MAEGIQGQERREVTRQVGMHDLPDPFRPAEVLQAVSTEVDERDAVPQSIGDEPGRDVRDEHLPAVPAGAEAGAADDGQPEVVPLVAQLGLAGVHGHPHGAARRPSGHGSACSIRWAVTAAATASDARLNAATTLSPSPCSTGRTPPCGAIASSRIS